MKQCKKCKKIKKITEFSKHATNKDGLCGKCKTCRLEDRRARQNKNFNPNFTGKKQCLRCKLDKPKQMFLLNKSTSDGFNGWCKECTKDVILQQKYGISLQKYNDILQQQGHKCAICRTTKALGPTNEFVVDHDHQTGKVRGLLCNHCNTGLGKLGDTIEALERAIKYLKDSSIED